MVERGHRSIGEVLDLLQGEFPDITISKIRFLESQGLLDPERTPSGYRKFYDRDIHRLEWILTEQRDHFLPLRVIKDRLDAGEVDFTASTAQEMAGAGPGPSRGTPTAKAVSDLFDTGASGVSLTKSELAESSGLSAAELGELERFGLLRARSVGNERFYDEDALLVAKLSADFKSHGVEARHLRMYKVAAEREAGLIEQLLLPVLKQRNPESRSDAVAMAARLASLGDRLRAAMLRRALRDYLNVG